MISEKQNAFNYHFYTNRGVYIYNYDCTIFSGWLWATRGDFGHLERGLEFIQIDLKSSSLAIRMFLAHTFGKNYSKSILKYLPTFTAPSWLFSGWLWATRGDFGHLERDPKFIQLAKKCSSLVIWGLIPHNSWQKKLNSLLGSLTRFSAEKVASGQSHPDPGWLWPPNKTVNNNWPFQK